MCQYGPNHGRVLCLLYCTKRVVASTKKTHASQNQTGTRRMTKHAGAQNELLERTGNHSTVRAAMVGARRDISYVSGLGRFRVHLMLTNREWIRPPPLFRDRQQSINTHHANARTAKRRRARQGHHEADDVYTRRKKKPTSSCNNTWERSSREIGMVRLGAAGTMHGRETKKKLSSVKGEDTSMWNSATSRCPRDKCFDLCYSLQYAQDTQLHRKETGSVYVLFQRTESGVLVTRGNGHRNSRWLAAAGVLSGHEATSTLGNRRGKINVELGNIPSFPRVVQVLHTIAKKQPTGGSVFRWPS